MKTKTYKKIHKSREALHNHVIKIMKRGGEYTSEAVKGGFRLEYSFPSKKK
jgi:hypothetical protein